MPRKRSSGLPTRKQILDFIATSDQPAGKREIARAFGLRGQDKIDLKRLLNAMADEGLIDHSRGRAFHKSGGVPRVTVLRVSQVDDSGNVFAVPEQWHAETPPPRLRIVERGRRSALGIGDRLVAVPMSDLQMASDHMVMPSATKETLQKMPKFDRSAVYYPGYTKDVPRATPGGSPLE